MDNLTIVRRNIDNQNISVFDYSILFDAKAVTIETHKQYGILVDKKKFISLNDEFMVICHEYGQCKFRATHTINSKYNIIEQHKYMANRQPVIVLFPVEMLKKTK